MKMKNKISLFKPKVPRIIKKLSWTQAKARFPNMNPDGDVDGDKVKNFRDCKPFDIKRQGPKHYMMYSEEDEHGLVKGKEEARSAKKILKSSGKKKVGYYEFDYDEE